MASSSYRADIDGLRGIAVLAVVGFHAWPDRMDGGFVGVDIFFVISGFLISRIIFDSLDDGTFTLRDFYSRRIRRIFPSLIVVLGACLVIGWFSLFADEYQMLGKHVFAGSAFFSNFAFLQEATDYFGPKADEKLLLHLWSLGIEEQFYICWPLLLLLTCKHRHATLALLILGLVLSFGVNIGTVERNAAAAFFSPSSRAWELLIGGMLAYRTKKNEDQHAQPLVAVSEARSSPPRRMSSRGEWRQLGSVVGAVLIGLAIVLVGGGSRFPGWWALLPTVGAALIISAGPDSWINRWILAHPLLAWFGLISYPLYLWHWPLLTLARTLGPPSGSRAITIAAVALSVTLAWLSVVLFERPIRRKHASRGWVGALCLAMLTVGAAGGVVSKRHGFRRRQASPEIARELEDSFLAQPKEGDGSCQRYPATRPLSGDASCWTGSANPEVMIVGDSHAMSLNLAAAVGRSKLNTMIVAVKQCLPFAGLSVDAHCLNVRSRAVLGAESIRSISTVIINFRFDRTWVVAGTKGSSSDAFVNGVSQFVHELLSHGKRVIFIADVPKLDFHPRSCVERFLTLTPNASRQCATSLNIVKKSQQEYRLLVAEIARQNPALEVFDPLPLLCTATECLARTREDLLYRDQDHLTISGSALLLDSLQRFLARDPKPSAAGSTRDLHDQR
ncbi:MAG: acyltransferase family protein [Gemmatimonadaceae bacterium]